MKAYIDKSAVVAEIERIKKEECPTDSYEGRCKLLWFERFLSFIETLEVKEVEEEPVSNDLEEAACEYDNSHIDDNNLAFKAGAKWQKEQTVKGVDLEKELIIWHRLHFKKGGTFEKYGGLYLANSSQLDLAKHFFELGLKAIGLKAKEG